MATNEMMATNESIRVIARFRPSFESEQKSQKTRKIDIQVSGKLLSLGGVEQHQQKKPLNYFFDEILDEKTNPAQAFTKIAQPICDGILKGYNGTIITYGQSGSGKSYTMYGPENKHKSMNPDLVGIIPRSCCYIFQILKNKHHPLVEGMLSYEVKCEFLEIQCNQLKDLFNVSNNKPQIKRWCVNTQKDEWQIDIKGSEKVPVKNYHELLQNLHRALKLNGRSSKSHFIMNLYIKIHMAYSSRTSVFRFCDLEGSEKMKEQLLKTYVGEKKAPELTYLLKNSFGGNCKTALIVCCSPDLSHINETIRSLNFGVRCRTIQNYPKQNKDLKKHQLVIEHKQQQKRIQDLEKQIEILNHPNQEYVNIYNETSVKAEKKTFMQTIQELQKNIKLQSQQIEQLGKEKRIMDKAMEKHSNDCQRLEMKNNEKNEEIQRLENINNELIIDRNGLKKTNEMLNLNNERLKENKQQQLIEINKLKTEITEQQNLQNKWETELDENKSKFSKHEMEMSQIIESLNGQLNSKNEELIGIENNLKEKENNIYELKDERNKLEATNMKLLSDIEKHLTMITNLNLETNEQKNIFKQQKSEIQELLLKLENKTNEFESMNNTIKQIKQQHETKINDIQYKLGNITESNKQLEEEKQMIFIQSNELQKHYYEIVQQQITAQIEADNKLALQLQTEETKEFIDWNKSKNKGKNKIDYIDSDSDYETNENKNKVYFTPGMKFIPDKLKPTNSMPALMSEEFIPDEMKRNKSDDMDEYDSSEMIQYMVERKGSNKNEQAKMAKEMAKLDAKRQELEDAKREFEEKEKKRQKQFEKQTNEQTVKRAELHSKQQGLDDELQKLRNSRKQMEDEQNRLKQQREEDEKARHDAEKELENLRKQMEDEQNRLKQQREEDEKARQDVEKELNKLKRETQKMQQKQDKIDALHKQLQDEKRRQQEEKEKNDYNERIAKAIYASQIDEHIQKENKNRKNSGVGKQHNQGK